MQHSYRHTHPPSQVIFIKSTSQEEVDLQLIIPYLMNFGKICYVITNPASRHALVEMETLKQSIEAVSFTEDRELVLNQKKFNIEFSKSKHLKRNRFPGFSSSSSLLSLLLFLIFCLEMPRHNDERIIQAIVRNPIYPITMHLLTQILYPLNVQKILIVREKGIQFAAEFETKEEAEIAMKQLNGHEIYPGACFLEVTYLSQYPTLQVQVNDANSWDFTQSEFPTIIKHPDAPHTLPYPQTSASFHSLTRPKMTPRPAQWAPSLPQPPPTTYMLPHPIQYPSIPPHTAPYLPPPLPYHPSTLPHSHEYPSIPPTYYPPPPSYLPHP